MDTLASSLDGGQAAAHPAKQPGRLARWLRRTRRAALVVGALLVVAHLAWKASGNNEWALARDQDGVQLWTQKTPGLALVRVKAAVKVHARLASMVKLLEDLDSCADAYCYDAQRLAQIPSVPGRAATYVRFKFDIPGLKTREYVLFSEHVQDPRTRQLRINILSAPGMLPRDECCVRVTHLHNTWLLTPLPDGQLGIEFTQDTDLGGVPYVLGNLALKEGTFKVLHDMQGLMDKPRYRDAQVEGIQEFGA